MSETVLSDKKSEQTETENQNPQEQETPAENDVITDGQPETETQTEEAAKSTEDSESSAEAPAEGQSEEAIQDASEEKAASEAPAQPEPARVPLAPRCENPIIGRKVFFINPPLYVENYLQPELKQHEYEAYVIKDYKYTKNALRKFPDALCFIFIDDELSYDGWFNFILSFQQDEKLKTIFVGLMSAMIPAPVREKFMMNLSLPGGFIMLNEVKGAALIENVIGILELNGAKGRRKYLRLDCDENVSIKGYFANQSQLLQVSIANISSVGFTCYYPKSYGTALAKNMLVPSFSITLGRHSIVTPSVVYDVKSIDDNKYFAVLLFLKQVGPDDRKVIKNFIFEHLMARFENMIYANPPDVEDYFGKNQKSEGENTSEEPVEEIEEAEEVEEAQEAAEETGKENAEKTAEDAENENNAVKEEKTESDEEASDETKNENKTEEEKSENSENKAEKKD